MQEKINKTIVFLIHFAIVMLIIGISIGIVQWLVSNILYHDIPLEVKMLCLNKLQNVSMYVIFIGFVIPSILAFMTNFTKQHCPINNGRTRRLRLAFRFYIAGSINVIALILYRGIAFMSLLSKDFSLSLDEIEAAIFLGNTYLKSFCIVVSYPIYIFGLIWFVIILWDILFKFVHPRNHG